MFVKGSRYRLLPDAATLDARGEWVRDKSLRELPRAASLLAPPPQRVLHTVLEGERLDLLAFKYYGDTTRWWQISDANPQRAFPTDLVEDGPLVEEVFTALHGNFLKRYAALTDALAAFGEVRRNLVNFFDGGAESADPDFVETTVVMIYRTGRARRLSILAAFAAQGFRLLRGFAWTTGANTNEAFTFDDPAAKADWRTLLDALEATPGVTGLRPDLAGGSLRLVYNSAAVARESLVGLMESRGFTVKSAALTRVGSEIVIPPAQVV